MSTQITDDIFQCVIVGGGVHGVHLAQRLLEDTHLTPGEIAIVDPHDQLLESFRRKARACGMESLRSTYVQHVGTEPFGLESFAEAQDRTEELQPTVDYPDRPSLDLFVDFADHSIDTKQLDALHIQATVESIAAREGGELSTRNGGGFELVTDAGRLETRTCVLAVGHGDRYRIPTWARGVDGVTHVWDGFEFDRDVGHTLVVGGGITAAQLAVGLDERVTMVSRHPLQWEVSEAEPPWLNWHHIERELHCYPRASKARLERVRKARYRATIPPHLYDALDSRLDASECRIVQGEITQLTQVDGGLRTVLSDGDRADTGRIEADRVVLATGFKPAYSHPFVDRLADALSLQRGYEGVPLLADDSLAWETTEGTTLPLYVSGALAVATVGPYGPNVPGARRAADRIVPAIERRLARRQPQPSI